MGKLQEKRQLLLATDGANAGTETIDGFPGRYCKACGDTDGDGLVVYTISDGVLTWNLDHG